MTENDQQGQNEREEASYYKNNFQNQAYFIKKYNKQTLFLVVTNIFPNK